MQQLFSWADAQGVGCGPVAPDARNRALIAARAILAGEAFVTIPQHLLLHAGICHQDSVYGQAFRRLKKEAGTDIDSRHLLCLLLIVERAKGHHSLWQPYIQYLPATYEDPLWWNEQEVALLGGTRLEIAVKEHQKIVAKLTSWRDRLVQFQRAAADKAGTEALENAADGWALSDQAVLWAKSTVWSRAFNIPYLGGVDKPGVALLPMGDLLNHDPGRHVAWHTGPAGLDAFHFITHTPVAQGCPLYSNYGNKSNEELILGYGFALPHNGANFFHIMIGLGDKPQSKPESSSSSPQPEEGMVQRRALLHHLGLSTSHYLKLQPPQGPGQAPQVALEPLLNTAAICLMPDHLAYHWWQAPAAAKQPQLAAASTQEAAKPQGEHVSPPSLINSSSQVVPGQVEVKAAPRLAHSQRPAVTATTGLVRPPPAGLPEASAPTSSSSEPSAQREPLGTAAGVSSASLEGDAQTANSDGSPFGCSPVHVQLQVLGSLQRLLTAKLDAIAGGSAEEDRALSQQPGCSQAAMMALEYRADQKEIAAAALSSLMRKTSEVVVSASARQPGCTGQTVQPEQSLVAEQAWWEAHGVLCNKLQESTLPSHALASPSRASLFPHADPATALTADQRGIVTTAALKPGELLISIPRHAVVIIDDPMQITLQLASIAYDQAVNWFTAETLPQAQTARLSQQAEDTLEAAGAVHSQQDAQSNNQQQLLMDMVAWWGPSGRVGLSLPAKLLLTQLWPLHMSSQPALEISEALAGLPVEQDIMLEAQQLLQQLQHLLPQLQSKLAVPSSAWQGEALLKAHVALLWAMCCMDQCSRASPEAKGGLLAPLIGTLPQELLGTVADLTWNADTGSLDVQAACHLPANTPLTSGLTALVADPEHLIMTHGLASLACAQQARRGQGPALLPWQSPDATSLQLCIEPPEEDELRDSKLEVLLASALGTTHVLTLSSSQDRLLAALAVCGCDQAQLEQLAASDLISAFHQCNKAAREHVDSAASSVQQDLLDKAEQQLQQQQSSFVAALLQEQSMRRVAQETLASLLKGERMQLVSDDDHVPNDTVIQSCHQSCMSSLWQYRQELIQILDCHLSQTQLERKHRKRKKGHSSKRH